VSNLHLLPPGDAPSGWHYVRRSDKDGRPEWVLEPDPRFGPASRLLPGTPISDAADRERDGR
jgi:hypothetical protein